MTEHYVLQYPEWRPDHASNVSAADPATQSPYLRTCQGVRPREDYYELHPTLNTAPSNAAGTAQIVGALCLSSGITGIALTNPYVYAGTATTLKRSLDAGATAWASMTIPSPFATNDIVSWRFAVTWEETPRVMAACRAPGELAAVKYPRLLIGSAGNTVFTEVSGDDMPSAATVACIGEFVVVGQGFTVDGASPSVVTDIFLSGVRWSGIGDPTSWPEIDSVAALAAQSGMQNFPPEYGYVTFIAPLTDRVGLVFQQRAIHRMSYIGGDAVWQFDTLSISLGNEEIHSAVLDEGWVYFCSREGFYRTNGQAIEPIGEGKVDRYFQNSVNWTYPLLVQAAKDENRNLIYWTFPDTSDTTSATNMLIFNTVSGRWSYIDLTGTAVEYLFTFNGPYHATLVGTVQGFDTAHKQRAFTNSTTFEGTLTTGDVNLNAGMGGVATILGVRPIADKITTAPSVFVRNRMLLADTHTSNVATNNTRTGRYDCRITGRYHNVSAVFTTASASRISGLEVYWTPTGEV